MSGKVMQAVLRGPGSPCMVTVKRPWRVSISIRSLGGPAAAASADGATTTDAGPDDMGTWKKNVEASDFSKTKSFRHARVNHAAKRSEATKRLRFPREADAA